MSTEIFKKVVRGESLAQLRERQQELEGLIARDKAVLLDLYDRVAANAERLSEVHKAIASQTLCQIRTV